MKKAIGRDEVLGWLLPLLASLSTTHTGETIFTSWPEPTNPRSSNWSNVTDLETAPANVQLLAPHRASDRDPSIII
jgi:hypothetical protein